MSNVWVKLEFLERKINRKRHAIYLVSIWKTVKPESNSLQKVNHNSRVEFPLPKESILRVEIIHPSTDRFNNQVEPLERETELGMTGQSTSLS